MTLLLRRRPTFRGHAPQAGRGQSLAPIGPGADLGSEAFREPHDRCRHFGSDLVNNNGCVDRWDYQACTQVLQPLGTNNRSDMFPPHAWTESWMTEHCRRRFSVSPGFEFMKEQMGLGTDLALH